MADVGRTWTEYALTVAGAVLQPCGPSGTNVVARITAKVVPRDDDTFDHVADRRTVRRA